MVQIDIYYTLATERKHESHWWLRCIANVRLSRARSSARKHSKMAWKSIILSMHSIVQCAHFVQWHVLLVAHAKRRISWARTLTCPRVSVWHHVRRACIVTNASLMVCLGRLQRDISCNCINLLLLTRFIHCRRPQFFRCRSPHF